MKKSVLLFALLFLVALSSYGQEVIIDTTFANDEPGKPPSVEPSGFPLEHPTRIEFTKGSSMKVLAQPEGNIKPPALLLTTEAPSGEKRDSLTVYWDLRKCGLNSGKYELTYTLGAIDSTSRGGVLRVDFRSEGWKNADQNADQINPNQTQTLFTYCRAPNSVQTPSAFYHYSAGDVYKVKYTFDLDNRQCSLWINDEEKKLDQPFVPDSDKSSPVEISFVLFTIGGDGEDGGRYVLGPVKLVKVSK